MNKIKLLTLLALACNGYYQPMEGIPYSLSVFDVGEKQKRAVIVGDVHTSGTELQQFEMPYINTTISCLRSASKHTKRSCWAIENLDPHKAKKRADFDDLSGSSFTTTRDSLQFLTSIAYNNNLKRGSIDFRSCPITVNNTALYAVYNVLVPLDKMQGEKISQDHLDILVERLGENSRFTLENFFNEADRLVESMRASIEQGGFSTAEKKYLTEIDTKAEVALKQCKEKIDSYKAKIPNFLTMPCGKAFGALFASFSKAHEPFAVLDWFVEFIVPIGDLKIIFNFFDLLKSYRTLILHVGDHHAQRLREFLKLDAKNIEKVAEDYFEGFSARPLPVERYKALCDEWICKEREMTQAEVAAETRKKIRKKIAIAAATVAVTVAVVGTAWWLMGWKKTQKRAA